MGQSKIFILAEKPYQLVPMTESPYDAEHVLQAHIAATPDLLPGDQIDRDNPRRWLLVKREAGIPATPDGSNYWSLDHILVDQDGIATFVECKRSGDSRLRREVVAQMLDYAANATEYWPKGKLRLFAEETARDSGGSLEDGLRQLLQLPVLPSEEEQEAYWDSVDTNLKRGRLRLLFVADAIPKELRRLVEFLNAKMEDIEVLAVELKQFINTEQHFKAFVPRVIGQTETLLAKKNAGKPKYGTIATQLAGYPQRQAFERIVGLAHRHGHIVEPGITNFSIKCMVDGKLTTYAFGKPTPVLQLYFEYLLLAGHVNLVQQIENILTESGYTYTGKYTINTTICDNIEPVLHIFDEIMTLLDNYIAVQP
jgi:hypothetical protein